MKKYTFILFAAALLAFVKPAHAQTDLDFIGATAKLDHYDALYVINSNDEKRIKGTLRNMANALDDPRLKGKLHIELICYDGWAVVHP